MEGGSTVSGQGGWASSHRMTAWDGPEGCAGETRHPCPSGRLRRLCGVRDSARLREPRQGATWERFGFRCGGVGVVTWNLGDRLCW